MDEFETKLAGLRLRQPSDDLDARIFAAKSAPTAVEAGQECESRRMRPMPKWKRVYPQVLAWITLRHLDTLTRKKIMMRRTIIVAMTASVMAVLWLCGTHDMPGGPATAFAQALEQLANAKNITWKTTYYAPVQKPNGKATDVQWIPSREDEEAFKLPGVYRSTDLDAKGQPAFIRIEDNVLLKHLDIDPVRKKATVREMSWPEGTLDGPFQWAKDAQKSGYKWIEKKPLGDGEADVYRRFFGERSVLWIGGVQKLNWSTDYWVDRKTNRIVCVQCPGADLFQPAKDSAPTQPGKGSELGRGPVAWIQHDIVYDAKVEDSLFSVEPPKEYAVAVEHRNYATEKDMIQALHVLTEYCNGAFPTEYDLAASQCDPGLQNSKVPEWSPDRKNFNAIADKPAKDRTTAQNKLIEMHGWYMGKELHYGPFRHFIRDFVVSGTWHYAGEGVKLGDKDRIVCWYKLKDAKDAEVYRAIYGDLSVKDVNEKDLPQPAKP